MKEIVVAIDFSDCSVNALEHAVNIAMKSDLDVKMVWVNNPNVSKISISSDKSDELIKEISDQFEKLRTKYQGDFKKSNFSYKIREGIIYKEIINEAKESNAKMIVMGTHGTSGYELFLIGSNANRVVANAPCPIITIRGDRKVNRNLSKIVLPIDSTSETRQKVPFTASLAKLYDAEIHILGLFTSKVEEIRHVVKQYVKQTAQYFEDEQISYKTDFMASDNITKNVIEYAGKVDANLISIMVRQEKVASNLWLGSYAQQMINHSPIPVLTIHEK
jgi:nucleotide-binding universal stress UspA family protein